MALGNKTYEQFLQDREDKEGGPERSKFFVDLGVNTLRRRYLVNQSVIKTLHSWSEVCYGPIANALYSSKPKTIVVFHKTTDNTYTREVMDWLLNVSPFSDCFVTKDLDKGFSEGFFMNVSMPYTSLLNAMILLRWVRFYNIDQIKEWNEAGANLLESLVLSCVYKIEMGELSVNKGFYDHYPFAATLNPKFLDAEVMREALSSLPTIPDKGVVNRGIWNTFSKEVLNHHPNNGTKLVALGILKHLSKRDYWGERIDYVGSEAGDKEKAMKAIIEHMREGDFV